MSTPRPTPDQCRHFWEAIQDQVQSMANQAQQYLPEGLDQATGNEILDSFQNVLVAADTAVGTAVRDAREAQNLNLGRQQRTYAGWSR